MNGTAWTAYQQEKSAYATTHSNVHTYMYIIMCYCVLLVHMYLCSSALNKSKTNGVHRV